MTKVEKEEKIIALQELIETGKATPADKAQLTKLKNSLDEPEEINGSEAKSKTETKTKTETKEVPVIKITRDIPNDFVKIISTYNGPSRAMRGKRYESWVSPEIAELYKKKLKNPRNKIIVSIG